jgi:hypothetical protein
LFTQPWLVGQCGCSGRSRSADLPADVSFCRSGSGNATVTALTSQFPILWSPIGQVASCSVFLFPFFSGIVPQRSLRHLNAFALGINSSIYHSLRSRWAHYSSGPPRQRRVRHSLAGVSHQPHRWRQLFGFHFYLSVASLGMASAGQC